MDIRNINKEDCVGCTACMAICSKHAIHMEMDKRGFLYPTIDAVKCIECGICYDVCKKSTTIKSDTIEAYAAKNTNDDVLEKSSSGGVSHALMDSIISKDGVVYGVAYSEDFKVINCRAEKIEECEKFFGSKYVQTNPGNTFRNVLNDLMDEKCVIYFGTSCHVAGLLSYLKKKKCSTEKLYTVDLICHGVPSPLIFSDYIKWINKKGNLVSFDFRTKAKPWGYGSKNYGCTITATTKVFAKTKTMVDTPKACVFLKLFFSNNCLRPACHNCKFIGEKKPSDITIADYWGVKEEHPDFYSDRGVSATLVHSLKGKKLLEESKELNLLLSSLEQVEKKQANMHAPSSINEESEMFWTEYNTNGFMAIAKKYGGYSYKARIKYILKSLF